MRGMREPSNVVGNYGVFFFEALPNSIAEKLEIKPCLN